MTTETHKFDPGGRTHWHMPRCKVCQEFEEHPIHLEPIFRIDPETTSATD